MNTPRIVGLPITFLTSLILSACGDSTSTGPGNTGSLRVTATTSGADPDPDGYSVIVDYGAVAGNGRFGKHIEPNGSVIFPDIPAGDHRLDLFLIVPNCTVEGDNPRTVTITAGETTATTFTVTCVPVTASFVVTTNTCGTYIDQDGYTINIDGVLRRTVDVNATVSLSVQGLGDHSVYLGDVASECVVCDGNPRVITVRRYVDTQSSTFPVFCNPDLTGRIAVVRDVSPCAYLFCRQIHLLSPDHRCPIDVSNPEFGNSDPALSPDGERIAFVGALVSGPLYLMNADGAGVTSLEQLYASHPSWSPDGDRIAFAKTSRQENIVDSDIYIINADGTGLVNLTGHLATRDVTPAWSPDGDRIAFASAGDLFVIGVDGTNLTRLTQTLEEDADPAWSPDATRIAFACKQDGNLEICVMNADGTGLLRLTSNPAEDRDPVWSPDGAKIAFTRDYGTVFLMNADGSDVKRFIDSASAPTWSRAQ